MRSKLLILLLCFLVVGTSNASETCGTIKSISRYEKKVGSAIKTIQQIEFDNGLTINDVIFTVGDQAFFAASMTDKLIICFNEEKSVYRFSSASK